MRLTPSYLVALFPACVACGEAGATPENCTQTVPQYTYVNATRYSGEDVGGSEPALMEPERILPSRFGSLLIPDREGAAHRAVPELPMFGTFGVLEADGSPRACDSTTLCGDGQECDSGRCMIETRYYHALPSAQEEQLVKFGYKPSPNSLRSTDSSGCPAGNPSGPDDPCIETVIVERCGDEGVDPNTCTDVEFPSCFTVPGSPGPGL